MKRPIQYDSRSLRAGTESPVVALTRVFPEAAGSVDTVDAQFLDARGRRVLGWVGLAPWRPIVAAVLGTPEVRSFLEEALGPDGSGLLSCDGASVRFYARKDSVTAAVALPSTLQQTLLRLHRESAEWAGAMTPEGDYVCDPRTPSPGTHFRTNLLVGDRAGFPDPLLTTPKAVVDEWGRGSSRSHADKQILATRWDVVPEEHGFPANRQFYVVEDGKPILYSAAPGPEVRVQTRHAPNHTVMSYETSDGLRVERTFFIVPAEAGLPLGVEAQFVSVSNAGRTTRDLRLVFTGMFGYPHPGALTVDVIYTCVTVEPRVLEAQDGAAPLVVTPRYTPAWGVEDRPFNVTVAFRRGGEVIGPDSFCLDYRRFVGCGSLEHPERVACLDNAYPKKGPAFFALGLPIRLAAGEDAECRSFNGLVSRHEGEPVTDSVMCRRMAEFAGRAMDRDWGGAAMKRVIDFQETYRSAVQVKTPSPDVDRLVNTHLPFQIRYQTYVSRSFGLTQKGFRQTGFREIQDLFGALPFELAAGRRTHVEELIGVWASHVHRFGYADHQFYWTGIEPGRYSDDALWLFQAVGRLIDLTGDASILDRPWPVAGEKDTRCLYDTLKAVLRYSGKISIGRNGLPLIDHADWNDTLNLDGEGVHGPEKEAIYRKQVAEGRIRDGDALESDLSESVMNGFLLEIARAYMVRFAQTRHDGAAEREWGEFGRVLADRLGKAWKGDFFARCFLNRPNDAGTTYLGASGDRLSADPALPGTYFLNSFSWSVLSRVATEEQIGTMLERLESVLLTPFGLRLTSPVKFRLVMPHAGSGDYAYGDRENGAVFKHANMMATAALLEAARQVKDGRLAERLAGLAWKVLRVAAPHVAFEDPYRLAGNPRFCTQYTNPATHEHVGPLVSGTAPWMWLSYLSLLGIRFREGRVVLDPLLPPEWGEASVELNVPAGRYRIRITKHAGFVRSADSAPCVAVDGRPAGMELPVSEGGRLARVDVTF